MLGDLFSDIVLVEALEFGYKDGEVPGPQSLNIVGECLITDLVFVV